MNGREDRIRGSGERGIDELKVLQSRQVSGDNKAQGLAMSVKNSEGHGLKEADSVRDGTQCGAEQRCPDHGNTL